MKLLLLRRLVPAAACAICLLSVALNTKATVVQVAAGYNHNLALLSDGSVVGWGWGDSTDRPAAPPADLANVIEISAGGYHSLAMLRDGSLRGWGDNRSGQATPPGLTNVRQISAGASHCLGLLSDGTVKAWGGNDSGQASPPASLVNVKQISAGMLHSLALLNDGTVKGWGLNRDGQASPPAGLANVAAISAGGWHSLALLQDGKVVAWGLNDHGQAVPPSDLANVKQIVAGAWHSVAVLQNGAVRAWGRTDNRGFGYNYSGPATVPSDLVAVKQVAAGSWHNVAILQNGAVQAWGDNSFGQGVVPPELAEPAQTTMAPASPTPSSSTVFVSTSSTTSVSVQTKTSSSQSTSATTPSQTTPMPANGAPVGAIAGGVVGGLVAVVLILFGVCFGVRRSRNEVKKDTGIESGSAIKPGNYGDFEHILNTYSMPEMPLGAKFGALAGASSTAPPIAPPPSQMPSQPPINLSYASSPSVQSATSSIQASKKLQVQASDVQIDYSVPPLGEGGFGVVYRGTLHGTNRVAIKKIRSGILDKRTMKAFFREVQAWEGLVQRNVLPLMAFCVDPPMLITDLMEEGDLRKYLSARGWDQNLGLKLLLDVATGMTYLHSKGILHGDLKTVNVMVDKNLALIADFGLSKVAQQAPSPATTEAAFAGTPGFVAPELIAGEELQAPADVFSFAMVAYEVVSHGKQPFDDEPNVASILFKVAVKRARPERPDGVRDDVWQLIERCWAHEPSDRPTFVEVREELRRILGLGQM